MPDLAIRPVKVTDAAALLDIYAPIVRDTAISFELQPPTVDEMAARIEQVGASHPWLVCVDGDHVAGYAYATGFRGRRGYAATRETTVYVHPGHHRRGVGRALMQALIAELERTGAHLAVAVIALPNEASVALHESLGFLPAGTLHGVARKFGRWHDEGFWELPVGAS